MWIVTNPGFNEVRWVIGSWEMAMKEAHWIATKSQWRSKVRKV